jgi:signal recognition particle subunit SRP19
MGYREDDKYIIYPLYFDAQISRRNGRRVIKRYAIEKPAIQDIFTAARSLGLNPELDKDAAHPFRQWKREGRIVIDKKDSKQTLIRQIAKSI